MKKTSLGILIIILTIFNVSCKERAEDNSIENKTNSIEKKVADLLSKMTLEEKIGQMNQYNGFWDVTGPQPLDGDAAKKYEH